MSDISIKEYFEARIAALEKATHVAGEEMNRRLESMNEFRAALQDQSGRFITRTEHELIRQDIRELREEASTLRGKASQNSVNVASLIAIISMIISIISYFHK